MGILAAVRDLLFPPKCIFCRRILRSGPDLVCDTCRRTLTRNDSIQTGTYFSRCAVPMCYEGKVRDAIIRYKFQDRPGYAAAFGGILARCIRDNLAGDYDLITWIPVSARRLKKRGYDQSMLLAMAAALELQDVAAAALEKQIHNAAQSSLTDAAERLRNVRGAYRVPDPELIRGKRVLIIDDVITTGATLDETARTLKEAGAAEVVAAALARPV